MSLTLVPRSTAVLQYTAHAKHSQRQTTRTPGGRRGDNETLVTACQQRIGAACPVAVCAPMRLKRRVGISLLGTITPECTSFRPPSPLAWKVVLPTVSPYRARLPVVAASPDTGASTCVHRMRDYRTLATTWTHTAIAIYRCLPVHSPPMRVPFTIVSRGVLKRNVNADMLLPFKSYFYKTYIIYRSKYKNGCTGIVLAVRAGGTVL